MKAAGVRRTAKEDENLTKFLRLDQKFPHLMQMKRVVKALEEVAQIEQKKMQDEIQQKKALTSDEKADEDKAEAEKAILVAAISEDEEEEEEEEEVETKKKGKRRGCKKKKPTANLDLLREAGVGAGYGYMNDYFNGASKQKSGSDA